MFHQQNKGVSCARNAGLRHASGDYIMFVDSDDEMHFDAVKILLRDALEYEADIVSAMSKMVDERGQARSIEEDGTLIIFRNNESMLLSVKGDESTDSVWAKIFKTAFIEGIYFEEGKNRNEDGFFMFECYAKQPVLVQHNVAVYQYNTRLGSSSRQKFSEKYLSMLYFCERKKEVIADKYPQYIEHAHNMEVRTNLSLLQVLCSTTDKKYKEIQNKCIYTVRKLYKYHKPINAHHKKLAWIVAHGLYPLYKFAVRLKYYR